MNKCLNICNTFIKLYILYLLLQILCMNEKTNTFSDDEARTNISYYLCFVCCTGKLYRQYNFAHFFLCTPQGYKNIVKTFKG